MHLIIGLGNPSKQYVNTRHNIGFMAIDKLAEYFNFENFKTDKKLKAQITKGTIGEKETILVKPQTFMNNSGQAVIACQNFFKIPAANILVIHDDIDIELGKIKSAQGGGSAGHNGIKSIIELLGTKNFARIRVGIDSRKKGGIWQKLFGKIPTEKFVLQNFRKEEMDLLNDVLTMIIEAVEKKESF